MKEIIKYLTELKANNNREWFQEHKNEYDVLRARFIAEMETLLSKLKEFDPDLAGLDVKSCLFRIYRDIRFSYDKTPYKPYFSIYFAKGGRKSPRAGYYFHFEPGSISLSGGVWCPEPKVLRALRQAIYDNSDEFRTIVENEQLKAENIRNQFEVLKNQLNPHMLFNSLNTLRSLVRENQDRAQDYIQELSRVLRYTLQGNESQCVTLREEMDFVSAYIFLLKMRFEDNLRFEINITHNSEEYLLPPMSIQMLIENAVKHNEISNRRPLTITIATDSEEGLLVSNPIQSKLTATTGTGIGLVNLDKRYRLLFRQEIQITEDRNFTVRIPLIRKDL